MDFEEKITEEDLFRIREEVRRRLEREKKSKDLVSPDPPPLYEIFFKGLEELWN